MLNLQTHVDTLISADYLLTMNAAHDIFCRQRCIDAWTNQRSWARTDDPIARAC